MSKVKLFPVVVEDFIPFCIFAIATNKRNAKKIIEKKYDWLDECANIVYLPPINLDTEEVFALDVEMNIIKDSKTLYTWLCPDEDGYYADGFKTKPEEESDDESDTIPVEILGEDDDDNDEETEESDDESSESDSNKSDYIWL
jgi:hypothetical protein